jgi:hypothetical protein
VCSCDLSSIGYLPLLNTDNACQCINNAVDLVLDTTYGSVQAIDTVF